MLNEYIGLSFKNLSQRRLRSWLTMIGIFIGIAAVVSLIGLGEGLRTAITSQFGFLGTDVLSVRAAGLDFAGPPGTGAVNPLEDDLVEEIVRVNGVAAAFNRGVAPATLEFNDVQTLGYIASVPEGENRKEFERLLNLETERGRLLRDSDSRGIVLGNNFAEDEILGEENVFEKPLRIGDTLIVNDFEFEVVGILEKKGSFIIDGSALMNEENYLDVFGDDGTTDIIAVRVKDVDEIDQVQEDIEKLLRRERDVKEGEEDFTVESPQSALQSLNDTLFAVQLFVYIVAGISLLVGGIGIMNTMYTAVLQRTRDIGIMKAIGARNSRIFLLFFIESGFLGMVGGIIGILLGLAFAYGMAALGRLFLGAELIQANVSPLLIFGALLFSFTLGTGFGVLPALQASKLQPVEALKK